VARDERAAAGWLFHIRCRAECSGGRNLGWDFDGSGTVAMKEGGIGRSPGLCDFVRHNGATDQTERKPRSRQSRELAQSRN
jgi:hypothetical protein